MKIETIMQPGSADSGNIIDYCVDFNGNPICIRSERRFILNNISAERDKQDTKWGFPQQNTPMEWGSVLAEEVGELCKELNDAQTNGRICEHNLKMIIEEAVQVAAVAVNIVEHMMLVHSGNSSS